MKLTRLGAFAASGLFVFAACTGGGGGATTAPGASTAAGSPAAGGGDKGTLKIAIDLPFQGAERDHLGGDLFRRNVLLAVSRPGDPARRGCVNGPNRA